jgi:SPP1 gp7 family putative phage head morphogenesis protein
MPPRVKLRSPDGKPKVLMPVHPNEGLCAAYTRKLERQIEAMHRSILWFVRAAYRANTPEIAADASPAAELRRTIARLGKRWLDRFSKLAPDLARWFATSAKDRTDAALKAALRKAGFTVRFSISRTVNDIYQATLSQNVSLIKSIASEHLTRVEGMVMRSVQAGGDLATLTKELERQFGVTHRRAALIARTQNGMATATITRARQQELGITHAVWLHSHGGRHPRPEHLAFSGKTYEVAKGAFLEGKWTWPGHEINCRCVAKSVIPGF